MNGGSNISGLENITTVGLALPWSQVGHPWYCSRWGAHFHLNRTSALHGPCTRWGFTFFDTRSVTPASVAAGGSPPSSQDDEGTNVGR